MKDVQDKVSRPADLSELLLMLDFDGTLVEIEDSPDGISVDEELKDLLKRLFETTGGAVAVVSGRRISDIDDFLPDFPGAVVGTHGAERRIDGDTWRHEATKSACLDRLTRMIHVYAEKNESFVVEEKPASIVLHFRQAPEMQEEAEKVMQALADQAEGFELHPSKMALEIQPNDVSKGRAAKWLAEHFEGRTMVAIGDAGTDESMFAVAEDRRGLAIRVGEGDTQASHRLESPQAVRSLLRSWLDDEGET